LASAILTSPCLERLARAAAKGIDKGINKGIKMRRLKRLTIGLEANLIPV